MVHPHHFFPRSATGLDVLISRHAGLFSFQSGNEDFSLHPPGAQSHRFAVGPGLANIKEIKRLRGGDLQVAAQANVQIDAEIGQKDHFRIENRVLPGNHFRMETI